MEGVLHGGLRRRLLPHMLGFACTRTAFSLLETSASSDIPVDPCDSFQDGGVERLSLAERPARGQLN